LTDQNRTIWRLYIEQRGLEEIADPQSGAANAPRSAPAWTIPTRCSGSFLPPGADADSLLVEDGVSPFSERCVTQSYCAMAIDRHLAEAPKLKGHRQLAAHDLQRGIDFALGKHAFYTTVLFQDVSLKVEQLAQPARCRRRLEFEDRLDVSSTTGLRGAITGPRFALSPPMLAIRSETVGRRVRT
jgi:hypothetical protein